MKKLDEGAGHKLNSPRSDACAEVTYKRNTYVCVCVCVKFLLDCEITYAPPARSPR